MSERTERMERKQKFNVFDIVIIVVVIAIAAGTYAFTHKAKATETKVLRYSLELNECPEGFSQNIKVGAKVR